MNRSILSSRWRRSWASWAAAPRRLTAISRGRRTGSRTTRLRSPAMTAAVTPTPATRARRTSSRKQAHDFNLAVRDSRADRRDLNAEFERLSRSYHALRDDVDRSDSREAQLDLEAGDRSLSRRGTRDGGLSCERSVSLAIGIATRPLRSLNLIGSLSCPKRKSHRLPRRVRGTIRRRRDRCDVRPTAFCARTAGTFPGLPELDALLVHADENRAALNVQLPLAVKDAVERQIACGIDVVNDGEYVKAANMGHYANYIHARVTGFALVDRDPATPAQTLRYRGARPARVSWLLRFGPLARQARAARVRPGFSTPGTVPKRAVARAGVHRPLGVHRPGSHRAKMSPR